jgi:hypothetical protein
MQMSGGYLAALEAHLALVVRARHERGVLQKGNV